MRKYGSLLNPLLNSGKEKIKQITYKLQSAFFWVCVYEYMSDLAYFCLNATLTWVLSHMIQLVSVKKSMRPLGATTGVDIIKRG